MGKKSKISKALSFAIIAVILCGIFSFNVFAADPVIFDFSKYDNVTDILSAATGGDGQFAIANDGSAVVLFAECLDGYDPNDDPDGKSLKGDLYASINDFASYGVDADVYQWMRMSVKNEGAATGFEVHFSSPTKDLNVETSITFDINPNSGYTAYIYNVTDACKKYYPKRAADVENPDVYPDHWHGLIDKFRLDFMYYGESGGHARTGDKLYIEYIAFFDSEQAAKDFVFTPAKGESQIKPTEEPAPADNGNDAGDSDNSSADKDKDSDSDGNNMTLIIIIAAAAVVVIAVIVFVVIKSGKGKGKEE